MIFEKIEVGKDYCKNCGFHRDAFSKIECSHELGITLREAEALYPYQRMLDGIVCRDVGNYARDNKVELINKMKEKYGKKRKMREVWAIVCK